MKNKDLYGLQRGLSMCGHLTGVKFAYAIAKNHRLVDTEIGILNDTIKPSEKFLEYDKKRADICEASAEKDENGKPKIQIKDGSQEYVIADKEGFDNEINLLQEKYKDEIENRKKQAEEYKKLLEEESEIKLHLINKELIPDDISVSAMELIMPIIDETDSVKQEK